MNKIDRIAVAFYKFWHTITNPFVRFVDKYGLKIAMFLLCYILPITLGIIPFGIVLGLNMVKGVIASVVVVTVLDAVVFLIIHGEEIEWERRHDRISG